MSTLALAFMAVGALATSAFAATWSASSLSNPSGITSAQLIGISCFSLSACTAVGNDSDGSVGGAYAEIFDGTNWTFASGVTRNPGPKNGVLNAVSCTAATTCMSAGSYGTSGGVPAAMAQAQSGTSWTLWNIGIPSGSSRAELNDVDCLSATLCVAVGYKMVSGDDKPFATKFNGSSWTDMSAATATNAMLKSVSCLNSSNCVAVGSTGSKPLAETWNGVSWSIPVGQPVAPSGYESAALNAVSCTYTSTCTAAGTYTATPPGSPTGSRPFAESWNAGVWSTEPANMPYGGNTEAFDYGIGCVASSETPECWTSGEAHLGSKISPWSDQWHGGKTLWENQTLSPAPGAEGAALRNISCVSAGRCKAVGWSFFGGTPAALVESSVP